MSNPFQTAKAAFHVFWKNIPKVSLVAVMDMVFLILFGFFARPFYDKIYEYGAAFFGEVSTSAPGFLTSALSGQGLFALLKQNPALQQLLWKLALIYLLYFLVLYGLYSLIQGFAWFSALSLLDKKLARVSYIKQFFFANILWMILYVGYHFLSLLVLYQETVAERYAFAPPRFFQGIAWLYVFFLVYFATVSYCLIGATGGKQLWSKAFAVGWKQAKTLAPAVLAIGIVFYLLNALLGFVMGIHFQLGMVVGIVVVIPAITWARVYWKMTEHPS